MAEDKKFWTIWKAVQKYCDLPEESKTRLMLREMLAALELFSRKQHDYSSINIAVCGEDGIWVRVTDKWARLLSHYRLGREMKNENIEDTWRDLGVYSFIALLVRKGDWKLRPEEHEILCSGS